MTAWGPCGCASSVVRARAAFPDCAAHPRLCMHWRPPERELLDGARTKNSIEYEDYAGDCMIITRMAQLKALLTSAAAR